MYDSVHNDIRHHANGTRVRPVVNPRSGTANHTQTTTNKGRLCDFRAVHGGWSSLSLGRKAGFGRRRRWLRHLIIARKARRVGSLPRRKVKRRRFKKLSHVNRVTLHYIYGGEFQWLATIQAARFFTHPFCKMQQCCEVPAPVAWHKHSTSSLDCNEQSRWEWSTSPLWRLLAPWVVANNRDTPASLALYKVLLKQSSGTHRGC
jgi:hypothetical protein